MSSSVISPEKKETDTSGHDTTPCFLPFPVSFLLGLGSDTTSAFIARQHRLIQHCFSCLDPLTSAYPDRTCMFHNPHQDRLDNCGTVFSWSLKLCPQYVLLLRVCMFQTPGLMLLAGAGVVPFLTTAVRVLYFFNVCCAACRKCLQLFWPYVLFSLIPRLFRFLDHLLVGGKTSEIWSRMWHQVDRGQTHGGQCLTCKP